MIRESNQDKQLNILIKQIYDKSPEFLYLDGSFKFQKINQIEINQKRIKGDSIIILYWMTNTPEKIILENYNSYILNACVNGYLNVAKWLYALKEELKEKMNSKIKDDFEKNYIEKSDKMEVFPLVCQSYNNDYLEPEDFQELIQWVYKYENCEEKTYYQNGISNYYMFCDLLKKKNTNLETLKWFYEIVEEKVILSRNTYEGYFIAIVQIRKSLEIAKWLFSTNSEFIKEINIHHYIFTLCCLSDNVEIAQWIHSIIYPGIRLEEIEYDKREVYRNLRRMAETNSKNIFNWFVSILPNIEEYDFNECFQEAMDYRRLCLSFGKNLFERGLLKGKVSEMISLNDFFDIMSKWSSTSAYCYNKYDDFIECFDWLYNQLEENFGTYLLTKGGKEKYDELLIKGISHLVYFDKEGDFIRWVFTKEFLVERLRDKDMLNRIFYKICECCQYDDYNLEKIKEFYRLTNEIFEEDKRINIHYLEDGFIKKTAYMGALKFTQWLYSLDKYPVETIRGIYTLARSEEHKEMRKWIASLPEMEYPSCIIC
jgi:hypothetical protein